jgi:hypothetical protein
VTFDPVTVGGVSTTATSSLVMVPTWALLLAWPSPDDRWTGRLCYRGEYPGLKRFAVTAITKRRFSQN